MANDKIKNKLKQRRNMTEKIMKKKKATQDPPTSRHVGVPFNFLLPVPLRHTSPDKVVPNTHTKPTKAF